jgi:hypothetical protein
MPEWHHRNALRSAPQHHEQWASRDFFGVLEFMYELVHNIPNADFHRDCFNQRIAGK